MQLSVSSNRFLFLLSFLLCFFCSACQRQVLTCRSHYLDPLYLASEQIDTPDPWRRCFYGQQIIVHWDFTKRYVELPIELLLHVRYGTRETETFTKTIAMPQGFWTYRLLNDDYWALEGIISYQAQICRDGIVLKEWTHHLWTEIITVCPE